MRQGPLLRYVEQARDAVVLAQERRSDALAMPGLQQSLISPAITGLSRLRKERRLMACLQALPRWPPCRVTVTEPPLISKAESVPSTAVAVQFVRGPEQASLFCRSMFRTALG